MQSLMRLSRRYGPCTMLLWATLFTGSAYAQADCPVWWYGYEGAEDECYGNCGRGCSNTLNPCTDNAGWDLNFTGPIEYMWDTGTREYCSGEDRCVDSCAAVQAPVIATYWGTASDGCEIHDYWCRNYFPECYIPPAWWWAIACDGQHQEDYVYEGPVYAVSVTDTQCEYRPDICPEEISFVAQPAVKKGGGQ